MRIIAGKAGGRRLVSPRSNRIRPTGERVREALFSMLGDLDGAVVVDGFAGTGALGLEALSRGARRCYFFDRAREAVATIRENIERVGVSDEAIVGRHSFVRGLEKVVKDTPDLWFLDPPYGTGLAEEALTAMADAEDTVTAGALVVWESGADEEIIEASGFETVEQRSYGRSRLVFFRRR